MTRKRSSSGRRYSELEDQISNGNEGAEKGSGDSTRDTRRKSNGLNHVTPDNHFNHSSRNTNADDIKNKLQDIADSEDSESDAPKNTGNDTDRKTQNKNGRQTSILEHSRMSKTGSSTQDRSNRNNNYSNSHNIDNDNNNNKADNQNGCDDNMEGVYSDSYFTNRDSQRKIKSRNHNITINSDFDNKRKSNDRNSSNSNNSPEPDDNIQVIHSSPETFSTNVFGLDKHDDDDEDPIQSTCYGLRSECGILSGDDDNSTDVDGEFNNNNNNNNNNNYNHNYNNENYSNNNNNRNNNYGTNNSSIDSDNDSYENDREQGKSRRAQNRNQNNNDSSHRRNPHPNSTTYGNPGSHRDNQVIIDDEDNDHNDNYHNNNQSNHHNDNYYNNQTHYNNQINEQNDGSFEDDDDGFDDESEHYDKNAMIRAAELSPLRNFQPIDKSNFDFANQFSYSNKNSNSRSTSTRGKKSSSSSSSSSRGRGRGRRGGKKAYTNRKKGLKAAPMKNKSWK
eukprot:Awhi_evm1s14141